MCGVGGGGGWVVGFVGDPGRTRLTRNNSYWLRAFIGAVYSQAQGSLIRRSTCFFADAAEVEQIRRGKALAIMRDWASQHGRPKPADDQLSSCGHLRGAATEAETDF